MQVQANNLIIIQLLLFPVFYYLYSRLQTVLEQSFSARYINSIEMPQINSGIQHNYFYIDDL